MIPPHLAKDILKPLTLGWKQREIVMAFLGQDSKALADLICRGDQAWVVDVAEQARGYFQLTERLTRDVAQLESAVQRMQAIAESDPEMRFAR